MRVTVWILTLAGASVLHADCRSGSTRPATPAESSFEIKVKTALQNALEGTMPTGWRMRAGSAIKASASYCSGEQHPIQLGYHVEYENAVKERETIARITAKTASDPAALKKITDEAAHDTDIQITIAANNPRCSLNGPSIQKIDVPGAPVAMRATGENRITTTVVCLGNWQITQTTPVTIEARSDLPAKGARTSIRNLSIHIQADPDRADELLKIVKLSDLEVMVGH
jgi:hypothetical protein